MTRLFLLLLLATGEASGAQQQCHEAVGGLPVYDVIVERTTLLDERPWAVAVAQDGQRVFAGTWNAVYFIGDNGIYHTARTGTVSSMGVYDSPLLHDGEFLMVGAYKRLFYFDPRGWQLGAALEANGTLGIPAVIDSTLLVPSKAGGLHFVGTSGTDSFATDVVFTSTPLVAETENGNWVSVAGGHDGHVYFFRGVDPEPYAKFQTGGPVLSSPALGGDGRSVLVGSHDGYLHSLDLDGRLNWSFETVGARHKREGFWNANTQFVSFRREIESRPAVVPPDGTVVLGAGDGSVYFLRPDGSEVSSCRANGPVDADPYVMRDGTVVVGAGLATYFFYPDGTLKALYMDEYSNGRFATPVSIGGSYVLDGREHLVVGMGSPDPQYGAVRVLTLAETR